MIKIDNREILTAREAKEKYENYYIGFFTTEWHVNFDFAKGNVVYLFDSENEGYQIAREYLERKEWISVLRGYGVKEVGGVEILWKA